MPPVLRLSRAGGAGRMGRRRRNAFYRRNYIARPANRMSRRPATGRASTTRSTCRSVRLVDEHGEMVGVVTRSEALAAWPRRPASTSSRSRPTPIRRSCKILDFGKFKYEEQKKKNEARKKQKVIEVKEIKLRPGIDDHDYDVKMRAMNQVHRGRRQGEGHHALPRPRDGASGARHERADARARRARQDRQDRAATRAWKAGR